MRKILFIFLVATVLSAQTAPAAEFLRGGFCQAVSDSTEYKIEEAKSILDEKAAVSKGAVESKDGGSSAVGTSYMMPKFSCDAFQGEVTIPEIYKKGWRVVSVMQIAWKDTREYSAKKTLLTHDVRVRDEGAQVNCLIIEEQQKIKK